jgi:hypothetical protein
MLSYLHTPRFHNLDLSQFYTLDSFKISINDKIKSLWKNDSLIIKFSGEIVKHIVTTNNGPNYIKYLFEVLHVENINVSVKNNTIELMCSFYGISQNYQVDFYFDNSNGTEHEKDKSLSIKKYSMTKNDISDKQFEIFSDGFYEENQIKKIIVSIRENLTEKK